MGKESLIGKGLWDSYSEKVRKRMNNPTHFGSFTEKDASLRNLKLVDVLHGSEACGDAVELFLLVEENTGKITDAKFKSYGCGTAIAAADIMTELCIGKTVDEAIKITNLDVEAALRDNPDVPAVPGQKMHCSVMAYDVIKKAVASYKGVDIKTYEEAEIVCHCGRITRKTIEDAIRAKGLTTVEQIMEETGAGSYCGSCIKPGGHEPKNVYLTDILEEILKPVKSEKSGPAAEKKFESMTVPQKLKALEKVLDEAVRPSLAADSGGVEIMDIDGDTVFIQYLGACAGCASSGRGTLDFIQATLRDRLSASIIVSPYRD
ncbi:MAG: iron-sulfur cluster assembly scaffold protein [Fibrobacteres bacterium]|nr:iron-sulfur cluster assembly scaffold protein [Fibrobacterota bacterium]